MHNDGQDHTRKNVLANEANSFANEAAWTDRAELKEKHSLDDHEMVFLDYLVLLQRNWQLTHSKKTYHITQGTRWLTDKLSPVSIERLEAWELIKRPRIDEGNGTESREQLMRRSLWDLGERAHDHLSDGYLYGEEIGDRNERMAHSLGCAAIHTVYNHYTDYPELKVFPYSKLDDDGPVFDAIIYDTEQGQVHAVVEVETRVGDASALARDAQKLAGAPGESWWLFPSRKATNRGLSNMQRRNVIGKPDSKRRWPDTLGMELTRERLREELSRENYGIESLTPPVTRVATYDEMRGMLDEQAPWAIYDYIGSETSENR